MVRFQELQEVTYFKAGTFPRSTELTQSLKTLPPILAYFLVLQPFFRCAVWSQFLPPSFIYFFL
jgi:hypothetical protein